MNDEKADKLAEGYSLGHYRILEQIGAGGMGEVYLAKDTCLERTAALKVLPSDVAANEERMRRFTQEAKAAAALNHPNIAHIYEIGEANGTNFIAMEYIEGVTLNEKIHREKAPLRKLLKYLTQTAEGLAKAHAAGIVHRDLKPDNIMIARDDYAKILDFGLAKLIEPQRTSDSDAASSEVATAILPQHSLPGMIMGTAGYMSPEQAQGRVREIDHRSDIFSFGCILYEAATRRKAFEGKDTLDSLHKIVHAPTTQIRDVNPDAPQDLQRIVRRCLAKEPDKRYQSIKDVAIELDELRQELKEKADLEYSVQPESKSGEQVSVSQPVGTKISQHSAADTAPSETARATSSAEYVAAGIKRHKLGAAIVIGLLVLAAAGIGIWIYKSGDESKSNLVSFQSAKLARLTTTGKAAGVAISPDGKYVAHVQNEGERQSLWIRQTATTSNVQIIPPAEVVYLGLTFSPDGNYIYYTIREAAGQRGTLYQMSVLGGDAKKVLTGIRSAVTFSPDGKQIAFFRTSTVEGAREDALIIANADGTQEKTLAARRGDERFHRGGFSDPSWSPDGKTITCPIGNFAENTMSVAAVSVETGEVRILTSQKWFAVRDVEWMADGDRILFNAQDSAAGAGYQIWQISFSTGETRRVTNDLINYRMFSLTTDSETLAVIQGEGVANLWVTPAGDSADAAQITQGKSFNRDVSWTPDARLVYNSNMNGGIDIYSLDPRGGTPKQLTANSANNSYPQVTPDGRYIVFMSDRAGRPNIWRMDLDGGNQKQLTDGFDLFPYVSPDSQWIVYQSRSGDNILRKVSIDGGKPVELTDYPSGRPAISPDGKQIAATYQENRDLPVKLALIPFEGGAPLKTLPLLTEVEAFTNGHWTNDGREIVYARTINGVSNLWAQPVDGKPARQITNFTADRIFWFDFSPDGKQLALSRGTITGDVVLISNFK